MTKLSDPYLKVRQLVHIFTNEEATQFIEGAGWKRYYKKDSFGTHDVIDAPMPERRMFSTMEYVLHGVPTVTRVAELLHQIPDLPDDTEYWHELLDIAIAIRDRREDKDDV